KIHAINGTRPAKPVAVIPLEQRPGHRRHLTARSRKTPCQAQPGAARGERCDFFGAEQVRQVSAQSTVQSLADTFDAVAFLGGQSVSQPSPQHRAQLVVTVKGESM